MSTCMIRIEQKDREAIRDLAREMNLPLSAVVGKAIRQLKQTHTSQPQDRISSKTKRMRARELEDQRDLAIAEVKIRAIMEDTKRFVSGTKLKARLRKLMEQSQL